MSVEWRDIAGYEGKYQVSNDGRIFSVKSQVVLKPRKCRQGYLRVGLRHKSENPKTLMIHKAVVLAFIGETPDGLMIRHKDGNKENNRSNNFEFGTNQENQLDRVKQGTMGRVLNPTKVRQIRKLLALGKTCKEIGEQFGCASGTVYHIKRGTRWGHIT